MANSPEDLTCPITYQEITAEDFRGLDVEITIPPRLSELMLNRNLDEDRYLRYLAGLIPAYGLHEKAETHRFKIGEILHKEGLKKVPRCILVRMIAELSARNTHEAWLEIKEILDTLPPDALVLINLEGAGEEWPRVCDSLEPYRRVMWSLCVDTTDNHEDNRTGHDFGFFDLPFLSISGTGNGEMFMRVPMVKTTSPSESS